jgi:hypothetical protein
MLCTQHVYTTCIHALTHAPSNPPASTHARMHAHMHAHPPAHSFNPPARTHVYMCIHAHAHTHTCTHTRTISGEVHFAYIQTRDLRPIVRYTSICQLSFRHARMRTHTHTHTHIHTQSAASLRSICQSGCKC